MSLNGGFILTPDLHPDTLVLTKLSQSSLGVGGGGVGLAVLLLPGLRNMQLKYLLEASFPCHTRLLCECIHL